MKRGFKVTKQGVKGEKGCVLHSLAPILGTLFIVGLDNVVEASRAAF